MTTTQIDRRAEAGTQTRRCATHRTDSFAWYFVGYGLDSLAYCSVCNVRLFGVAAEHDPSHIAAYDAYINSPATVAKLTQIALDGAKERIKFGPAGRRRIIAGTSYRYSW